MFPCPFCSTELTDDRLSSGRCPECGGVVKWDEPASELVADAVPPAPSTPAAAAASRAALEASSASAESDREGVPAREIDEPSMAPGNSPRQRASGPFPPTVIRRGDTSRPQRTLSADDVRQVDELWRGTYSPGSRPNMTIKGAGISTDGSRPSVIKPRVVRTDVMRPTNAFDDSAPDYELLEIIGEGGVGVVYAARQTSVNRTVAVKMLRSFAARDPDSRDKFLMEAAVTGELDHPNIVPVYDLGTDESGAMFYSMKRVEGTPWSAVIREKSLAENLEILLKAADALAFAHARGVIHRDLKPDNVMLGSFGEVLVMDWGIALSTSAYLRQGTLTQSNSMGGTPAYMAPEMATGPLSQIGPRSDVYLLGALLFEIVTGLTPHTGQDVLSCLHAAARNEIQPTDKDGELLDIAYRAMSTEIENRPESVHAFQQALRAYQSHSESIVLATRAETELEHAQQSHDYKKFARALFAYQEALALWPENVRAAQGLQNAQLSYARSAYDKGDYDLGLSVLDESDPVHRNLRRKLLAAQQDRKLRQLRLQNIRRIAVGLATAIIVVLTIGVIMIQNQKRNLDLLNGELQSQQTQLMNQQEQLLAQREELQASNDQLDREQARLKESNDQLEKQKTALSSTNQQLAVEKQRADAEAQLAREQEQRAEQASYVAQIGLAAAQIDENAFLDAQRTIEGFQDAQRARWRHWEWGRLKYVCERAVDTVGLEARVECGDWSPSGEWLAAGLANGQIRLWQKLAPQPWATWQRDSALRTLALAPASHQLAVCQQDRGGTIELLSFDPADPARSPTVLRELTGHTADVVRLRYSADGQYLVSASLDQTAILWNVASGQAVQVFRGHFGPVWDAILSADNQQVYTAGEDRTVGIWDAQSGQRLKRFRGHQGPVHALAVTSDRDPQRRWVVSGGEDRAVLAWRPEMIDEFDYERLQRKLTGARGLAARDSTEQREPSIRLLLGHSADVRCLAISPDNRWIASGSHDNTVRVWSLSPTAGDSEALRTLRGHGGWVRFAAFSPDGEQIVSGGYDQQVKRWQVADYAEFITLQGHEDAILDAAYSADGSRVITVGRDQKAILWEAASGQSLRVFEEGHDFLTSAVASFPAGDPRLATSAGDGTTILWRLDKAAQQQKLSGTGQNSVLAIAPGGNWIFTGSEQNELLTWPVRENGTVGPAQKLTEHYAPVSAATVTSSGNGDLLAFSGDALGGAVVWQLPAGSTAWTARLRLRYQSGRAITAARFLLESNQLLTASADQTLRRWNLEDGEEIVARRQRFEGPVKLLELLPGGERYVLMYADRQGRSVMQCCRRDTDELEQQTTLDQHVFSLSPEHTDQSVLLALDSAENALWRWDLERNQVTPFWSTHGLPATVWAAQYLPGKDQVVTVGGNVARVWDVATGRRQQSLGPHGPVLACDFAPHGRSAATAGQEGSIKIWDLEQGRVRIKLPPRHLVDGRTRPIHAIVYATSATAARLLDDAGPEQDLLLSVGGDGTARLWWIDDDQYREGAVLKADGSPMLGAAFSPDGRYIATASADGAARLWDANTGEMLRQLKGAEGHRLAVIGVAFSRDGRQLATASDDNTAILWEVASGRALRRFTGHTAGVTDVDFSPDARRLITASQDGTAKLWDAASGDEILTLKGHSAELTTVAFSPDGRTALTAALDGRAIVWPATDVPAALVLRSDPLDYGEPGSVQWIDDAADFIDPDNIDFDGAELLVELPGQNSAGLDEQLHLRPASGDEDPLQIAGQEIHAAVRPGEAQQRVATWQQPSPRQLRIQLLNGATPQHIRAVLRRVAYSAEWQTLPLQESTVRFVLTHRDGRASPPATRSIRFQSADMQLAEDRSRKNP